MNRRMTKWGSLLLINGILLLGIINSINSQDRSLVSLGPQTVRDIDGNVYHTITIGKQVWMLENLKTTRYNDSTSIPLTREDKDWNKLSIPGFCWYNNDPAFKSEYGALYNYYSVNTGKLAPKGWHVANEADWKVLIDFLGGESVAGGKMKEKGTVHWKILYNVANDSSHFSALPGGCRLPTGKFILLGREGYWWIVWLDDKNNFAESCTMVSYNTAARKFNENKSYGMSVRCVKD